MNFYPEQPPHFPNESENDYRTRLLNPKLTPYDHPRSLVCALNDHENCQWTVGGSCLCPCHFDPKEDDDIKWVLNAKAQDWELVNFSITTDAGFYVYLRIDTSVLNDGDKVFAAGVFREMLHSKSEKVRAAALKAQWMDPKNMVSEG